jgi:hypothetical protein
MDENFLGKQYVDHFLQAQIIEQLVLSDKPLRFSELKEEGIDNSLFMYHANKLIDRGLIEKHEHGFRLTTKGARWANYASSNLISRKVSPKLLVQAIIKAKDSVLIANRTGSMKELINECMLPGGLHHFGKSAEESMTIFLTDLFTEPIDKLDLITIAEVIIGHDDEFVYHTISNIYAITLPDKYKPRNTEKFEYNWLDLNTVKKTSPLFKDSQIVPIIIKNQSSLKQYEIFNL